MVYVRLEGAFGMLTEKRLNTTRKIPYEVIYSGF